jgi:hypothetical protein
LDEFPSLWVQHVSAGRAEAARWHWYRGAYRDGRTRQRGRRKVGVGGCGRVVELKAETDQERSVRGWRTDDSAVSEIGSRRGVDDVGDGQERKEEVNRKCLHIVG